MHSLSMQILRRSTGWSARAARANDVAAAARRARAGVVPTAHHIASSDDGSDGAAGAVHAISLFASCLRLFPCDRIGLGERQEEHIDNLSILSRRWMSSSSRYHRGGRDKRGSSSSRHLPFRDCRALGEAVTMAHDHLDDLTDRNLSAFWTEVPKLLGRRDASGRWNPSTSSELEAILVRTMEGLATFGYRDLTQAALGIAKTIKILGSGGKRLPDGDPRALLRGLLVGHDSENKRFIFSELAVAAMPILHDFDPRHLSNLIYAFGLAECAVEFEDGRTFFDVAANVAMRSLRQFNGQDLSNMLWAYGNVEVSNPMLFESAGDTIINRDSLEEFAPQALANIVWAYATTKEPNPELFKNVADHMIAFDNLRAFNPQALANIVWAYATAKESHPNLFKKVANHITALDNLRAFNAQDLSNTVWAYATAKESNPQLFKTVAEHIVVLDNLRAFTPQALANTVWAFATASESNPRLFKKVADHIVALGNLREFTSQDLANTVWAYATAKEPTPKLFWKVADAALAKRHNFNPQGVANFLWAFAANGEIDEQMFRSWESIVASQHLSEFNEQNLANVAWAYAVANVSATSLFNDEFLNVCSEKETKFPLEGLSQLHQWQLWQREMGLEARLPPSLEEKCYEAFVSQATATSALQDDVVSNLHSIGVEPDEEVLTSSGYRIDAIVKVSGVKVAVEVDGPSHFVGREPTGSTILKHRQVTNLDGMRLVSVPYWEWDELRKDGGKKKQYLRAAMGLD